MAAAKKATVVLETISEVKLIPLELIKVHEQVRKEFEPESIQELAQDIAANGLMQPVLVNPTPDGSFELISGERRLRAVRKLGQAGIPALVTKAGADQILIMQLAENIQREELNMEEEAAAVAKLYEKLKSLDAVSKIVHRSKAWCSKRYSLTLPDSLDWKAKRLVEAGATEDLELVRAYNSLNRLVAWDEGEKWFDKIIKGEAGRNEVRQALKEAKEKKKAAEEKTAEKTGKVSHAKPKEPKPSITWRCFAKHAITHELVEIDRRVSNSEPDFWYEIGKARFLGLDGEIWKNEEKIKEWFWNEKPA